MHLLNLVVNELVEVKVYSKRPAAFKSDFM